jgi:hypothetical protein
VFERVEALLHEAIDSPNPRLAGSRDENVGRPWLTSRRASREAMKAGGLRAGGEDGPMRRAPERALAAIKGGDKQ